MSLTKSLFLLSIVAGLTIGFVILSQGTEPITTPVTKTFSYEKFSK